jgi:broad specificity phosphatase PhoE
MPALSFRDLKEPSEFYFVRHGESEGNRDGRIQGREDAPLTETGIEHARAAGRWFSDKSIDRIYTSPLTRSRQTAEEMASSLGLGESVVLDDLIELDTGILTARAASELKREDPELYRLFQARSWEVIPGAEKMEAIHSRAIRAWERMIADAASGSRRLVAVTHGGTLQWLIKATMTTDLSWMPIFTAHNCGVFRFVVYPTAYGAEDELGPHDGCFRAWDLVNFSPYEAAAPDNLAG